MGARDVPRIALTSILRGRAVLLIAAIVAMDAKKTSTLAARRGNACLAPERALVIWGIIVTCLLAVGCLGKMTGSAATLGGGGAARVMHGPDAGPTKEVLVDGHRRQHTSAAAAAAARNGTQTAAPFASEDQRQNTINHPSEEQGHADGAARFPPVLRGAAVRASVAGPPTIDDRESAGNTGAHVQCLINLPWTLELCLLGVAFLGLAGQRPVRIPARLRPSAHVGARGRPARVRLRLTVDTSQPTSARWFVECLVGNRIVDGAACLSLLNASSTASHVLFAGQGVAGDGHG